ncbi:MAG TPA: glycosyltransferase family 4 protein [Polyangiaceae bacterium]|nr:glycosyltransferase family 4 protein [Polyangiaceae bacterium]
MANKRLRIVFLTQFPPSPPSFGAQRRIHGLMSFLSRANDVIGVSLITPDMDARETERAMREYCSKVVLVSARPSQGATKRLLQLRSLASTRSFESRAFDLPDLRNALRRVLSGRPVDIVNVELPFLAGQRLDIAPPGSLPPLWLLDEHNIEFDLARQQASGHYGLSRRIHYLANWSKIRREEVAAFRTFHGVTFCSEVDQARARRLVPELKSAVVPNAVDVDHFKPSPQHPPPDGQTVMFFGAINYFPNVDGVRHLVREVWPLVTRTYPDARLKIVGQHPTPEVLSFRSPRVEVTGKVDDLRPHLASSAVTVVPLRIGGGTRFKILESMAMARPVVSTSVGAEGIGAQPGRHLLIGDSPTALASGICRVLEDPALGAKLGEHGRALVEERYSWVSSGQRLESFMRELLASRRSSSPPPPP